MAATNALPEEDDERLHTEPETAVQLNVSPHTLKCWRLAGKGPKPTYLDRMVRYRPADIRAFINAAARRGAPEPSELSKRPNAGRPPKWLAMVLRHDLHAVWDDGYDLTFDQMLGALRRWASVGSRTASEAKAADAAIRYIDGVIADLRDLGTPGETLAEWAQMQAIRAEAASRPTSGEVTPQPEK